MKNPDYELEIAGYEKDDPKLLMDIDKGEIETFKTLNEKRAEKGLEPIDFTAIENPADMPINPYTVQLLGQQQQGGGMGGGLFDSGDDGGGGGGFDENNGFDEGGGGPAAAGGSSLWDAMGDQDGAEVAKSLHEQRKTVRIVV